MARKDLLKGPMEGTGPTDPARLLRYDRGAIGAVSQSINDLRSRAIIDVHADMIDDAVLGKSPLERLDQLGRSFVVTESMGIVQNGIGDLGAGTGAKWEGSLPHLLLHGGVGCVALPAMDGQCDAGFFAGAAQSVLAGSELSDQDKQSLASLVGSMAGYLVDDGSAINVSFGGAVAIEGLANNACSHKEGGCRTTKEEKALADVGDFAACYKLACKGGDLYACNAVYISTKSLGEYWEAKFNSIWSGMSANTPASLGLVSSMYEMDQLAKARSC